MKYSASSTEREIHERQWAIRAYILHMEEQGFTPRMVLLDGKKPIWRGWPRRTPTESECIGHVRDGGNLGIEPHSVESMVFDFDKGDLDEAQLYMRERGQHPYAHLPTQTPGHAHFYIRIPSGVEMGNPSTPFGEEKCKAGVVGVYDFPRLTAQTASNFKQARLYDPAREPEDLFDIPPLKSGERWTGTLRPPYVEGERNNKLYRFVIGANNGIVTRSALRAYALEANQARCIPPLSYDEVKHLANSAYKARQRNLADGTQNSRRVLGGKRSGRTRRLQAHEKYLQVRTYLEAFPYLTRKELADHLGYPKRTVERALSSPPLISDGSVPF